MGLTGLESIGHCHVQFERVNGENDKAYLRLQGLQRWETVEGWHADMSALDEVC
ncbi:MAG TPA: hypothetical protein VK638_20945 [Edaphobacter sp.]|nr:hypothetical protein [Edaphobacter sp.]